MARPLLGDQKRSEIIHVRVTKAEKEALEKVYGKAANGLHALMIAWLGNRK